MRGKCCACDVRLTPEQCAIECEMCPTCRAEHDAGYAAFRRFEMARLYVLLARLLVRRFEHMRAEMIEVAPRAPWVYTPEGEN